ncbi:MAG: nitroreductase family protein [Clostridia bacterium]|nr:nitroreductase family protein [Clostridia bacterium]
MDFMQIAKKRYSVRQYQNRPVEPEKLNQVLEAARVAPTAANLQPVRLIAVRQAEGLAKIAKAANVHGAPVVIVVCADHGRAWTRPFDGKQMTDVDASILTTHMMLEATELGLGSLWVAYFKPDVIRQEFNLPQSVEPIALLALGYADGAPADPDRHADMRIPMDELVCFETY